MAEANTDRLQSLSTKYKWIIGGIAALLISPIIFLILKGLVGIIVALVVGITTVQLAPVFALKLANWRMKLLVAEVTENPIETLQNLVVEKTIELSAIDQQIIEFGTEIQNFDDQISVFKTQYPEEAPRYVGISDKMHELYNIMQDEQANAKNDLKYSKAQLDKANAIFKMSLAAQKVTTLSKSAEAQVFADIKQQVAFDTIRTQLNRTFSNLNVAVNRRKDAQLSLPVSNPNYIESTVVSTENIKR